MGWPYARPRPLLQTTCSMSTDHTKNRELTKKKTEEEIDSVISIYIFLFDRFLTNSQWSDRHLTIYPKVYYYYVFEEIY